MSGFDRHWLALRDPVDRRSRDQDLLSTAAAAIRASNRPTVLDVGCGTGSTLRALGPKLADGVRWRLFDQDELLLDEAKRRHGGMDSIAFVQGDLNDLAALPLADVGLVTASALFDLCSDAFVEGFVARLSRSGAGLYAALNYDGAMEWSIPHPQDAVMVEAFNRHQTRDKGFGPSLGPAAWARLAERLRRSGYELRVAPSPWLMSGEDAALQRRFIDGMVRALSECDLPDGVDPAGWADFRQDAVEAAGSLCRVGHQDVLALP